MQHFNRGDDIDQGAWNFSRSKCLPIDYIALEGIHIKRQQRESTRQMALVMSPDVQHNDRLLFMLCRAYLSL